MNILLNCPKEELNSLINTLKIINIVKLVIPILLILYLVIKLIKSNNDKSIIKLFVFCIVFSLLIYFSPNILFFLNNYIGNNKIACLKNIDKNVINVMEILNKKEEELIKDDYIKAYNSFNTITSEEIKDELADDIENLKYLSGYENIHDKIELLIENYKESLDIKDYNLIINLYERIKDQSEKDRLNNEITSLKRYVDIVNDINKLSENYDKVKYKEISKVIDEIENESIKVKLKEKLASAKHLPKLNATTGVTVKNENGKMPYLEAIPENPTEDMPLIIYLHGDWGGGIIRKLTDTTNYIYENIMKNVSEGFIFVAPTVSGYNAQDLNWQTPSVITALKGFIDGIINEYKIDTSRIIIMGHSRGAVGVWDMVSRYPNFFSIAIPVSCGGTSFKASSFKNTIVWGFAGGVGTETRYRNSMRKYVREINEIGGNAKLTEYDDKSHAEMGNVLVWIDLYKWILEQ